MQANTLLLNKQKETKKEDVLKMFSVANFNPQNDEAQKLLEDETNLVRMIKVCELQNTVNNTHQKRFLHPSKTI